MTIGERIKECRQRSGLSQEKVAQLVGVSRQAVTKWESGQSAPNTENLFRLAEIFGTSVDLLLQKEEKNTRAEELYALHQEIEARKREEKWRERAKRFKTALTVAGIYLLIYLLGRILWCGLKESTVLGGLLLERPTGEGSYLYGWLCSKRLLWWAMAASGLLALWGKQALSWVMTGYFTAGLLIGTVLGPNPAGAAYGHGEDGWAYWAVIFALSLPMGLWLEKRRKRDTPWNLKEKQHITAILLLVLIFATIVVKLFVPDWE